MEKSSPLAWHFKAISALAVVVLIVDAYFSGLFGLTINNASAIGLAAISIGSGLLLVAVFYFYKLGFDLFAKGLAVVWGICFAFNVLSNMGVATANRVVEVQNANLKQAVYQEKDKSRAEAKARLGVFEKQLSDLISRNAWAATVTADGLRSQVAALQSARDSEAKLGGCGQKCRGLENQIADIQGQIAVAEQRQNLDKRIEATKRVLAEARTNVASADAGVSHTAAQASLYSRWTIGWFSDGESVSAVRNSNELMGMGMAFVIAVASAGLTLAGVWQYLMTITPEQNTGARSTSHQQTLAHKSAAPVPFAQAVPRNDPQNSYFLVDDTSVKEKVRQILGTRYGNQQVAA